MYIVPHTPSPNPHLPRPVRFSRSHYSTLFGVRMEVVCYPVGMRVHTRDIPYLMQIYTLFPVFKIG